MHSRVDRLNEENLHLRNRIGELEEIIGIHRERFAQISSIVRKGMTKWVVRSATLYGWFHTDGSRCQHFSVDRSGCLNASNGTWRPVFIVVGPPETVVEVARQARMAVE